VTLRIGVLAASRIAEKAIVGPAQELGYRLVADGLQGQPSITRAHAEERTPGVDARCDVELVFPGGATGFSTHSMAAEAYSFTLRIIGSAGDVFVHDFIRPNLDDRLTISGRAGQRVERLGTRSSYTYQLETFAAHVQHGAPLPYHLADAVANMSYVDAAYEAAGLQPR
jgi:predicted dehydrogenase